MTTEQQFSPDWFSKPGDSLASLMQRRQVTAQELASKIEGGMDELRGVLAGSTPIGSSTAQELATAVGGTSEFWLRRQANYERALDRAVRIALETEGDEWLQRVAAPGSRTSGQLSEARRYDELRRRLRFFNVNSLEAWTRRYGCLRSETQFRTSPTLLSDEASVSMWLRQGELEAALVATKPWSLEAVRRKIIDLRKLSKIGHPARFLPKLKDVCAEAGIALVVVRAPKGCRASGASRFIRPDKAMILMSFRFRVDDQFWFTFFHELGHLLLHGPGPFIDDDETVPDEREREANKFASGCIIPEDRQIEFARLAPSRDAVLRFSVSVGVAPGLTVGQMQHRQMIGYERLNALKRRWTWNEIEPALSL